MSEEVALTKVSAEDNKDANASTAEVQQRKRKRKITAEMASGTSALIMTRILYPLMLVIAGVIRLSVFSGVYLIIGISYIAYSYPRPPTKSSYLRPLIVVICSIVSFILEGIHMRNPLSSMMKLLFGLLTKTETNDLVASYFASDVIAIVSSMVTIIVLIVTQLIFVQAQRDRESIPVSKKDIIVKEDGVQVTLVESSAGKNRRRIDSEDVDGEFFDDDDDDESDSQQLTDSDDSEDEEAIDVEEEEEDYGPTMLFFVPTMSYGRSLFALFISICAASFAPSVLAAPYAIFVLATFVFIAWPRRKYTIVNLPGWTSICGMAVFAYAVLHTLVVYAFQFYYKSMIVSDDAENSGSSSFTSLEDLTMPSDMSESGSFDSESSVVLPSATVAWMGLFDYNTFREPNYWMVIVSYCMTLLLLFVISPAVRSFKRVTEKQAAKLRERYRCPDFLTPILALSVSVKGNDVGAPVKLSKSESQKLNRRNLILSAVYPHAWKVCIIIIFFVCVVSPGVPTFVCLGLLLLTTFTSASFAASTSSIFFLFYLLLLSVQYVFATGIPPACFLVDKYTDLILDLSIPSIPLEYAGLFFILCFCGLYCVALFIRIRVAQRHFIKIAHTLDLSRNVVAFGSRKSQQLKKKMKIEERKKKRRQAKRQKLAKKRQKEREEMRKAAAAEAAKKRADGEIDIDDDTDPYAEPMMPPNYSSFNNHPTVSNSVVTTTTTTTTTPTSPKMAVSAKQIEDSDIDDSDADEEAATKVVTMKPVHKESSASRLKRSVSSMYMLMGRKGQDAGNSLKSVLLTIMVDILRFAYFLSLIALYFTAVNAANVLNIFMMIVFIIFLVKPVWARKGWAIFLAYVDIVFLLRCVWYLHWIPENGQISTIIGLDKNRSIAMIKLLVCEVILVLCATIQLFFLRMADVTEDSNGGSKSPEPASPASPLSPLSPNGMVRNSTLDSIAEQSKVELLDKIGKILAASMQHGGLVLCCLCWVLCGLLMPLSIVSLSYLLISFICIMYIFYVKNFPKHLMRIWVFFLIWEAIALGAVYVFQCSTLQDVVLDAYSNSTITNIVSIDEFGLIVLKTSGERFAGMLPYVVTFVVSILQLHMFSISQKCELDESTLSPVFTGIVNFICRFFFIYSPLIMYIFSAVLFVEQVSLVHFILLFVMMMSRVSSKGLDKIGGTILWLCQLFVLCTMVFNLRAFDPIAEKYAPLFRWIGFAREYVPIDGTGAHTENLRMVYEYIVLFILICIERRSLKWGESLAKRIGWCADRPRYMPLFRFLDDFPSWSEEERNAHPWMMALNTLCNLPLYLTKQTMLVILLLAFYFRSATLLGWVYLFIVILTNRGKERLRKMAPWITALLIFLNSFQYICTLGRPSLYGDEVYPWMNLGGSVQQWLLLYMPHPVLLVVDILLLYFVTAVRFLDPNDPDFFLLISPSDKENFPNPPRSILETIRYVFYRVITLFVIIVMLIIGFSSSSAVAIVFLVAALVLLVKQDYILNRYHPWKTMLFVCYVLIIIQLVIQLTFMIVDSYSDDSEVVLERLKIATVVLGIDFTSQDQIYPTSSALYLMMVLLVLSFLRGLHRSNKDAFYMTRVYVAELRLQAENEAMEYNTFKTDVVIKALEKIFSEKAERRRRLEGLRESRKRRRLLFPDLMAEIDDNASTVSGGSLLSANEALYRANVKDQTDDDEGKGKKKGGKKEKIPFKTRFADFWRMVGRFCLRVIDRIIFWLHGKEGECEGSRYGRDLKILREDHEALINAGKKKPSTPPKQEEEEVPKAPEPVEPEEPKTFVVKEPERPAAPNNKRRELRSALLTKEALQLAAQYASIETYVQEINKIIDASKNIDDSYDPLMSCTMLKCASDSECADILGDFSVKQLCTATQNKFEGHDDVREMLMTLQAVSDDEEPRHSDKCPHTLGAFITAAASKIGTDPKLDKLASEISMGTLFKYITYEAPAEEQPEEVKAEEQNPEKTEGDGEKNVEPGERKRKSRWTLFYTGLGVLIGTSSESLCMLAFLINFLAQGTILSCVYVFFGFGYVSISRRPHPLKPFWNFICIYTAVIIGLKTFMQLPGMCICHASAIHIWYFSKQLVMNRTNVTCPEAACMQDSGNAAARFSPPYFFGLVTQSTFAGTNLFWDVIVLIAVLFHMRQMIKQGLWNDATCDRIEKDKERFVTRLNELKIEDATASPTDVETTEAVQGANEHYLSFSVGEVIHVISRSTREGATSIGELDGVTGLFDITLTKPYIPADALRAAKKKMNKQGDDSDDDEKPKSRKGRKDKKKDDKKDKKKKKTKKTKAEERKTLKYFYDNLIHDSTRLGGDYYTPMFFFEFVCFVYLLFAASSFTGSSGALIEYIKQSYLPGAYVAVLLFQFAFIIIDRIVYLRRSVLWKLILQYVTLVLYHVLCLWYFPAQMELSIDYDNWNSGFSGSATLQVFYLFKCIYWYFSGLQIREGYPMLSCDRFLMRTYGMVNNWIHTAYRCIPFVYEMRTILDWTFIPTTLDFFSYLRVEDIYAELYNVGCLVAGRQPRKPGEPQTIVSKLSMGCLLFIVIVIVIWLPLILLSSAVPGLTGISISPINDAQLTIAVEGLPPFYEQYISAGDLMSVPFNESEFKYLRRGHTFISSEQEELQWTRFTEFSSSVWDVTPPGKDLLRSMLANESNPLSFTAKLTVSRSSASNSVVTYSKTTEVNKTERRAFLATLLAGNGSSFTFSGLLPRYIKTPGSTGDAESPCDVAATAGQCTVVNFTLSYYGCFDGSCPDTDWGNEFWGMTQVAEGGESIFNDTRPEIIFIHTPVSSSSSILGTLAAYGLIGIYATIILAVANLIRGMTSGLAHRIMFVVLPNPYDLLQLCHDVILARMDGDLLLEEELSNELIQIYRSPESIIDHTRIPIPPPEEQDDLDGDLPDDIDLDDDDDDDTDSD